MKRREWRRTLRSRRGLEDDKNNNLQNVKKERIRQNTAEKYVIEREDK